MSTPATGKRLTVAQVVSLLERKHAVSVDRFDYASASDYSAALVAAAHEQLATLVRSRILHRVRADFALTALGEAILYEWVDVADVANAVSASPVSPKEVLASFEAEGRRFDHLDDGAALDIATTTLETFRRLGLVRAAAGGLYVTTPLLVTVSRHAAYTILEAFT